MRTVGWPEASALAAAHPHDFTIQYPPSRRYFQERFRDPLPADVLAAARELAVYLHVPFCAQRCFYCNFAIDLGKQRAVHQRYVDALVAHSRRLRDVTGAVPVAGVDIGGGTPTLLAPDLLQRVVEEAALWTARAPHPGPVGLSIETTPQVAATEPEKLDVLRRGGVTRISVGLQSTHDDMLEKVNRRLQRSLGDRALENLDAAGFARISVDLVFGLPGQTTDHLLRDLARIVEHRIDAVTLYDCLYRGQGRALPRLTPQRPGADDYGRMYDAAAAFLAEHGFHAPYGSINFSRHPDQTGVSAYFEARLLHGVPVLGIGNYASSMIGDRWWFAPEAAGAYVGAIEAGQLLPTADAYLLPAAERMAKHVLFALSFGRVPHARFEACFGAAFTDVFAQPLAHAVRCGWLEVRDAHTELATGAFRHLPQIRSLFYSPGAVTFVQRQHGGPL